MSSPANLHPLISIPSTGLVLTLASQSLATFTALDYNFSYVISSVTAIDVGAQLKSIGDSLDSARTKDVMRLTSIRVAFAWCLRALHVMYETVV